MKLYWALGGTSLLREAPLPRETIDRLLAREPWLVGWALWATVFLAVFGAVLALAMARPWGQRAPRWLLVVPAALVSVAMTTRALLATTMDVHVSLGEPAEDIAHTARWDFVF
ncbi:DUF3995 domain-containing protein [Longimycelium tulufanense]|uniref:DUF3995 domain-containing protein n=1 Tax=Longimycelium tulufanense TaxID=907463 RepID=UPI001E52577E|nr:DUF3995 domain-containing protein [Longimycelium tulufanense]